MVYTPEKQQEVRHDGERFDRTHAQLDAFHKRFQGFFCRSEGRKWSMKYLQDLMMSIERKNVENIADPETLIKKTAEGSAVMNQPNRRCSAKQKPNYMIKNLSHIPGETFKRLYRGCQAFF